LQIERREKTDKNPGLRPRAKQAPSFRRFLSGLKVRVILAHAQRAGAIVDSFLIQTKID